MTYLFVKEIRMKNRKYKWITKSEKTIDLFIMDYFKDSDRMEYK